MKKLFVIMLCLVALLAIVSCKQDPKTEPNEESAPNLYYRFTATRDAKRIVALKYAGGENGINPEEGDILTFKYRSSHPVTHLYLRNDNGDSSPEFAKKKAIDTYISVPDGDGWITFTFTYPEMAEGTYPVAGMLLEMANYTTPEEGSHDEGLGKFLENDYIEIKDLTFNGDALAIEGPSETTAAVRYQSNSGVWNSSSETNTDHAWPVLETIIL